LAELLQSQRALIELLGKCKVAVVGPQFNVGKMDKVGVAAEGQVRTLMSMEGLIDVAAERARLAKDVEKQQGLLAAQAKKLENEAFVSKAPPKLIEAERAKVGELEGAIAKLQATLKDLGA
jgi:valyl-tRNA synthetase